MQERGIACLEHLPADVLENHILLSLSFPSLIACLFTGSRLRVYKSASRVITLLRKKLQLYSKELFLTAIFKLLFKEGCVALAEWFQRRLHFPVFGVFATTDLYIECVCYAAKGITIIHNQRKLK